MKQQAKARSLIAGILNIAMLFSMFPTILLPTAVAAQTSEYHDPAENWVASSNRTDEFDVNSAVRQETFLCHSCDKETLFTVYRVPEYTKSGVTARNNNVMYSDGVSQDGSTTGNVNYGTPNVDGIYTGYHWCKAVCNTCGTINGNFDPIKYGYNKNVYHLYDCSGGFTQDVPENAKLEYVDSTYHKVTKDTGKYCGFCYGTHKEISSSLVAHNFETKVTPQLANQRFAVVDTCKDCGYSKTSYVAAKSVVANYYGIADGAPHTLSITDLSDESVRTKIRYGNTADSCTLATPPSYTAEGQYTVYYETTYTYESTDIVENGVAYVWLRNKNANVNPGSSAGGSGGTGGNPGAPGSPGNPGGSGGDGTGGGSGSGNNCSCGCQDTNCGCQDPQCAGDCCAEKGCNGHHSFTLLEHIPATCLTLGYDRYLCMSCGKIEKQDYEAAKGHAWQSVQMREATCETDGMLLEICSQCGQVKTTNTPRGAHKWQTSSVPATCVNPGYNLRECSICHERSITDLINVLAHDYENIVIPASCTTGGKTIHRCKGCGNSFESDYVESLDHSWDAGRVVQDATCTSNSLIEFRCTRCNISRLEGGSVSTESNALSGHTGHTPGAAATCINPQTCTQCGVVLAQATGHDFNSAVTAPTCTSMGFTTFTCKRCQFTYKGDYINSSGHNFVDTVTPATCDDWGYTTHVCTQCNVYSVTSYQKPLTHHWDSGTVIINSTCNGKGMKEYKCTRCDAHYLESESAEGHTPGKAATCTDPQVCKTCGAVLEQATGHLFQTDLTKPTCTTAGSTTYTCKNCDFAYSDAYVDPLGHHYVDNVVTPSCEQEGFTTHTCDRCKDSFVTDYRDALDHKWDNGTVIVNSTCNGKGMKEYKCVRCDAHYLESESAEGHTPGEAATCTKPQLCTVCQAVLHEPTGRTFFDQTTEPTCTTSGFTTHICKTCDFSCKNDYTDALGHQYVETVIAPTCSTEGYTTHTCERCNTSFVTDHKDALGHDWDKGTVVVNSTCNGKGMTEYKCERCDAHRFESESAEGHTPGTAATCTEPQTCTVCGAILTKAFGHHFVNKVTPPTCLEDGYTTHSCDRCNTSFVTDYKSAFGHQWDGGTEVVNSTCNGKGMTEYKCERCDAHRLESESAEGHTPGTAATCTEPQTCTVCGAILVKALGHHVVDQVTVPTCLEQGFTSHACDRCGKGIITDYKDALGHDWDEGTVMVNSTCNGKGMTAYKCKRCDTQRLESESAEGHTPGAAATCTEPQTCTVCGAILAKSLNHHFVDKVTAPTCLEQGFTSHACDRCGEGIVTDYTAPLGHNWEGTLIHNATCTGESLTEYHCTRCEEKRFDTDVANGHYPGTPATCTEPQICTQCGAVIEQATGHHFTEQITDPTCVKMGFTSYKCDGCGVEYQSKYMEPLGHRFVATNTVPTCLEQGYTTHTCDRCGISYVDTYTEPLGHDWDEGTNLVASTCNGKGMTEYHCKRCDYHLLESESAEGHTPGAAATCLQPQVCAVCGAVLEPATNHNIKSTVTPATCLEMGFTTYACESCDFSYNSDYTKPLGHNHVPIVTDPTCLEQGFSTYTCDRCGDSYITNYTDALGHEWDEGTLVSNPTCTGQGVKEYHCQRCDYHRLQAESAEGHTPGAEPTCDTPQLCTVCGAVLQEALGHEYQDKVTAPTCLAMGFTTHTCTRCNNVYQDTYVDATGHTPSDWIVEKAPTYDQNGSQYKKCEVCGEKLESEVLIKLYLTAITDTHGETVVGEYQVTVVDSDTGNPIIGAVVTKNQDGTLSIRLPDGRLLDYADQTTITVQLTKDKTAVANLSLSITDQNKNHCTGNTNQNGQLIVPSTSGQIGNNGNTTAGNEDINGDRWTLQVKVMDIATNRPIDNAKIEIGKTGIVTVTLPDGTNLDANHRIQITITDQNQAPQSNISVIVKNDQGITEQGQTNKDGIVIVPSTTSGYTNDNGNVIVGQYTVIVTDPEKQPIKDALVTLLPGTNGAKDSFAVTLPDGRVLDANSQTTVMVLLPTVKPAVGLSVKVQDNQQNQATKETDYNGQITVPEVSGSAGNTVGSGTVDKDDNNTTNITIKDKDNKPIKKADIEVDKKGNLTIKLPDDFIFSEDGSVYIKVTDNRGRPKPNVSISIKDGDGEEATGETDKNGQVTLPKITEERHISYIVGYTDGSFAPGRGMTRAEAATIFARLLAEKNGDSIPITGVTGFADVPVKAWYSGYIKYLKGYDVVYGRGENTFSPNAAITRAEFIAMASRFFDAYGLSDELLEKYATFNDVPDVHWASAYIKDAAAHGWIEGYEDGSFHADRSISRAEVVTVVNRLLNREADQEYISDNIRKLNTFPDVNKKHWAYYDVLEAANSHDATITREIETWNAEKGK